MAAHHLSLAKAAFAAALLRPDFTKISRDDLNQFHTAFEAALARCSRHNIQVWEYSGMTRNPMEMD
jgi:hypothetical protein